MGSIGSDFLEEGSLLWARGLPRKVVLLELNSLSKNRRNCFFLKYQSFSLFFVSFHTFIYSVNTCYDRPVLYQHVSRSQGLRREQERFQACVPGAHHPDLVQKHIKKLQTQGMRSVWDASPASDHRHFSVCLRNGRFFRQHRILSGCCALM